MTSPEVLSKLITDNLGLIFTFALRLNRLHADEIVQEACLGIMRSKTYDPEVSVAAFLHWQVRGAFSALKKREHRFARAKEVAARGEVFVPEQESVVDFRVIRDRVAGLHSSKQRHAVSLVLADHNFIEIGKAMGITHQAAHQLVTRARPALGVAA